MNELIFAWIGAVVSVIALICLLSWLWIVYNNDVDKRYNEKRDEKLKEYDDFAKELNRQSDILGCDEWGHWSWEYYNFEKLTKEMIELRKFKKNNEKALAEIGGEDE
ncbi:hypothetical protein [Lactococcus garvieae]|uniref:Phage protein n=1 Tax=Lactococcus garvieae TaxID=1363 RepID=A0AAX3NDQ8_9LACT|nr:hypothetical protein [Lactococcus garvieae]NHI70459.1 hypothetical protein [Lactococcus garvieae]NHJ06333.1 hypothetical protein [Lactococcus garvieae]WEA14843.1 hypothetical protein PWF74_04870 [Lactococcus garvieae]